MLNGTGLTEGKGLLNGSGLTSTSPSGKWVMTREGDLRRGRPGLLHRIAGLLR